MTDRDLNDAAYSESLDEPLDTRIFDTAIQKDIEDIKGIVAVLDPVGFAEAEKMKAERERRYDDAIKNKDC